MADISKIKLPGGTTVYNIKDTVARANALPSGGTDGQIIMNINGGPAWGNELAPKVEFVSDTSTTATDDYIMNVQHESVAGGVAQLATVATTGRYQDLISKPGFVVAQQGGSNKYEASFTSNTPPFSVNSDIINLIYPVGSIYISTVNTNPYVLFGVGTWVAFGQGRTLIGMGTNEANDTSYWGNYPAGQAAFNYVEEKGGEAYHTLTINEMPNHSHTTGIQSTAAFKMDTSKWDSAQVLFDQTVGLQTDTAGGGQAHNNIAPYITVYMWKRTA